MRKDYSVELKLAVVKLTGRLNADAGIRRAPGKKKFSLRASATPGSLRVKRKTLDNDRRPHHIFAMVAVNSTMLPLGTAAPEFSLPDTNGKMVGPAEFKGKPLVVMFICNHCPYVKHIRA